MESLAAMFEPEDARILAAALEQFALTGVRRTSTDDIARRAGVNRATLYRRLGTKDQIVGGAMVFEATRVLAEIDRQLHALPDGVAAEDFIVRFFVITQATLHTNPLLVQLLEVDRDETLFALTGKAGGILTAASSYLADRIREIRARAGLPSDDRVEAVAAAISRLSQSLLLTPDGPPRVDTERAREDFARAVLVPMILG
ncbi:TetR/AcrR family transcriptional regulator [Rhodococcus triatomae]|uniref:TetR/AcrR family transcriptional regulator n=1 Tax=Rhodococcus triatomae TaxID=300028 RepID=UPI00210031A9|nr:TetR/AcrR family transcriptional regulator [Rhodococcus triatomae]